MDEAYVVFSSGINAIATGYSLERRVNKRQMGVREKEVLQSDTLVLANFWHEQCPWCKRLEPIYSEVAEEYKDKVKFAKLNVLESLENQQIAVKYGIMGTPTFNFLL